MKKSWFYPFIAGFYDFYFVALLMGAIVAFGVSVIQIPTNIFITLAMLLIAILMPIVYHALLAQRFEYLSPGEMIVGRQIQDGHKTWCNPYNYNRWALFLVIALDLLVIGNSWDRLSDGYVYSFMEFGIRLVIVALVLYGLIDLARGRIRGVLYPVFYFVLLAFQITNDFSYGASREALQFLAVIFAGIALLNLVCAAIYGFLRDRHNRKEMQASS